MAFPHRSYQVTISILFSIRSELSVSGYAPDNAAHEHPMMTLALVRNFGRWETWINWMRRMTISGRLGEGTWPDGSSSWSSGLRVLSLFIDGFSVLGGGGHGPRSDDGRKDFREGRSIACKHMNYMKMDKKAACGGVFWRNILEGGNNCSPWPV